MKQIAALVVATALIACGCGGDDDDDDDDSTETYVRASIDGQSYEGNSQGATFNATTGELLLFPADPISGTLFTWTLGATGEYAVTPGSTDMLLYIDSTTAAHLCTGSIVIDDWQVHTPVNSVDPLLGFITGTFAATCVTQDMTSSVELTDGEFRSRVHDSP